MKTIAVLDTETSGVDPETARIVSVYLGYIDVETGAVTAAVNEVIAVDVEIPDEAVAVHGITTELARHSGRPAAWVIDDLFDELIVIRRSRIPLVVMNAPYDLTLIHREFVREFEYESMNMMLTLNNLIVLDPSVLDRRLYAKRSGKRRLQDLVHYYHLHLPTNVAHSADWDAYAAGLIALKQLDNDALSGIEPAIIHEAQQGWYADQAAQIKKLRPNEKVNYQWPWIPPKGISE